MSNFPKLLKYPMIPMHITDPIKHNCILDIVKDFCCKIESFQKLENWKPRNGKSQILLHYYVLQCPKIPVSELQNPILSISIKIKNTRTALSPLSLSLTDTHHAYSFQFWNHLTNHILYRSSVFCGTHS